jgi:ABC-type sulfate transport system substrate-binding protein
VTVVYDTESFDIGGNCTTTTFTAPVTGKYLLSFGCTIYNLTTAADDVDFAIVISNGNLGAAVLNTNDLKPRCRRWASVG